MEGKEVRFGIPGSSLFGASTTVTSTGAVNSFHDSFTAFGGGILLFNMMLGEVVPGGVGAGLYGMLVLAVVTVFIAGLMVGRTPEYVGKKIRPTEMKWASLYILCTPAALIGAALFGLPRRARGDLQLGAAWPDRSRLRLHVHGQQQRVGVRRTRRRGHLYQSRRRSDAGRPVRAGDLRAGPGGSLAKQQPVPASAGTLDTRGPLFASMLVGVVIILVGLTYFPALALGPFAEGLH